jgi:hypothetical protein
MKVSQFRKVLDATAQLYRDGGNEGAAQSLEAISSLLASRETVTVAAFAALVAKFDAIDRR